MDKKNLLELDMDGMKAFVAGLDLKPFRAAQLMNWIYARGLTDFGEMTNIAKDLRTRLAETAEITPPELVDRRTSTDGTEKYLFRLSDGELIESVLIPDEKRITLCISSQAGCALGCGFCLTGAGGYRRDLTAHEITGQVYAARTLAAPLDITNYVMMGMGEPLLNTDNVFEALRRLTSPEMFAISPRRITLSTAGVVPGIKALGESGVNVNLAVSLNAPSDEIRDLIMPINRKYPLKKLIKALKEFPLEPRRRITIEYVLLRDINDSVEDAEAVAKLLRGLKCKVNLIPYNASTGSEFAAPRHRDVLAFQEVLADNGYTAFIRTSRGADILAACGQLRAKRDGA